MSNGNNYLGIRSSHGGPMDREAGPIVKALNSLHSKKYWEVSTSRIKEENLDPRNMSINIDGIQNKFRNWKKNSANNQTCPLYLTLQSCGGHPHSNIFPYVMYQSPNNSILEKTIKKHKLDFCVYPFQIMINDIPKDFTRKWENYKELNEYKVRRVLTTPKPLTMVIENTFPIYSLQKKDISGIDVINDELTGVSTGDIIKSQIDFLKLAYYIFKEQKPKKFKESKRELQVMINSLQLDLNGN